MHYGRILAIVGVVIGAVGLFLKKASSDAEQFLGALSEASGGEVPSSLDENTWTALYNDTAAAAIVFAIAAVAVVVVAFMPPLPAAMKRLYALAVTVLGVVMLIVGVFATLGAGDDADTLEAGLAQFAAAGAIPEAFAVNIGFGWYLLIIAGVVVAIGGVVSLIARPDEDALSSDDG